MDLYCTHVIPSQSCNTVNSNAAVHILFKCAYNQIQPLLDNFPRRGSTIFEWVILRRE